jgi:hypothetical protein
MIVNRPSCANLVPCTSHFSLLVPTLVQEPGPVDEAGTVGRITAVEDGRRVTRRRKYRGPCKSYSASGSTLYARDLLHLHLLDGLEGLPHVVGQRVIQLAVPGLRPPILSR